MKGNCEFCKKYWTCEKEIGLIYGFCRTDFEPVVKEVKRDSLTVEEFATVLKEYARSAVMNGYDGIGENDIDYVLNNLMGD